ncbi:MAG: hypothetical protein JXA33_06055 [Anaerolineae bacterium]|nr:hypothetical protein [Anaerolineae bacterium]
MTNKHLLIITFTLLILLTLISCGKKEILENVTLAPDTISPNADGTTDLAKIEFLLNRSATVAIYLYDTTGREYTFRPPTSLALNEDPYTVYFGGIVEGFTDPGEALPYHLPKRMLPDGVYTWKIEAMTADAEIGAVTGQLRISEADTAPPGIQDFQIQPTAFSPNQDGIQDAVTLNLTLEKDVEALNVYLIGIDGVPQYISEEESNIAPNMKGPHIFKYDGGIDAGNEPPPDGNYVVYAEARDKMGQRAIVSQTLKILNAGLPMAYIVNGNVEFSDVTLVLSDTLCYTLTVENDSDTYIRTTGPWPGTNYRSDQNFNTLGWPEDAGIFRIGMDFDTSLRNYPFRWGLGRPGVELVELDGHWYLPPRARSQVTGCVQIVEVPIRNPLYYWMGLLHEGMETATVNNRVDPHFITIWEP